MTPPRRPAPPKAPDTPAPPAMPAPMMQLRLPERWTKLIQRTAAERHRQSATQQHHGPHGMQRQVVRAKDFRGSLKRLLRMLHGQRKGIVALCALVAVGTGLGLLSPLLMKGAVDALNAQRDGLHVDMERLLLFIALMGGCHLLNALNSAAQGWISTSVSQNTVRQMRSLLFDKLQHLPVRFFDSWTNGEILSRMTNDIGMISNVLANSLVEFFGSIVSLAGALIAMLSMSWSLTLVSLATIPLCLLLTRVMGRRIRSCSLAQQTVLGLLNSHIEEITSARKTVMSFNHEPQAIEDFELLNRELQRTGLHASLLASSMFPIMNMINNLGFALLVTYGGWQAAHGDITIGVIAAFIQYSRQFSRPVNQLANQYNEIQSALASAERVFVMLDEEPEPADPVDAIHLEQVRGELEFRDVTFAYKPGEPVLRDFSLHVQAGQKIALVGSTGAGKTTVASLLMRFYEPQEGDILLDGNPIRSIARQDLRHAIAMVLQETQLFSGTVMENIRYGRMDSSDEEVMAAARTAGADVFIRRLPQGYNTPLSENGSNLSQGQRQLLSIARAVLANPPILILDEATSNVDTRTEMSVQRAMIHLMRGRTCLVIAHRLSTIRDANTILVLEGGRIVEQGNRNELLALKGAYWNLEQSQAALFSQEAS